MPLKLKPLNNHILVELQREYAELVHFDQNETLQKGIVLAVNYNPHHLTGAAGYRITTDVGEYKQLTEELDLLIGKTVMWSEGAEAGTIFKVADDDKSYALVPFWRLIGFEDNTPAEDVATDKEETE